MSKAPIMFPGVAAGSLYQTDADGYLVPIVREDGSAPDVDDVVTRVADLHGAGLDGWAAAPGGAAGQVRNLTTVSDGAGGWELTFDADGNVVYTLEPGP